MNIKYEADSIKNSEGTGKDRNFVRIFDHEPLTAKQLKSHIQNSCSLTEGDVEAALSALSEVMINELTKGNRFHIPSVGYFSLSTKLEMPEGKPIDKVRGDYIRIKNIRFRPEASVLQKVRENVRFERAELSAKSHEYSEEELLRKVKELLSAHTCINRQDLEDFCGLKKTTALQWLRHFTETGVLIKKGARNSPFYLLNPLYKSTGE